MIFITERMRRFISRAIPIFLTAFAILCIAFSHTALAAVKNNADPMFKDPGEDSLFSGFSLAGALKVVGIIVLAVLIVTLILRFMNRTTQNRNRVSSKDLGPPPPPPGSTLKRSDSPDISQGGSPDASGQNAQPPRQEKDRPQKTAPPEKPGMKDLAAKRWASYSSKPPQNQAPEKPATEEPKSPANLNARPDVAFNQESFLEGARVLYSRLQEAWAARDVDNIATFATPEMLAIIKAQAAKDPTPYPVRILLVNAMFEGMRQEGPEEIATVRFETVLRHGNDENAAPVQVRERWFFSRRLGWNVNWLLDGIEQL